MPAMPPAKIGLATKIEKKKDWKNWKFDYRPTSPTYHYLSDLLTYLSDLSTFTTQNTTSNINTFRLERSRCGGHQFPKNRCCVVASITACLVLTHRLIIQVRLRTVSSANLSPIELWARELLQLLLPSISLKR